MAAATRMTRIWAAGALPVAGFFLGRVYADGKKVHPMELEIYDKPMSAQEIVIQDPPSDLELKVSAGRKQVLGYWGSVKNLFGKGELLVQTASSKTSEFMALISTDQTFQIKVAIITSGVLVGAILAGRGRRRIRRTIYSVSLGTFAASICYPQKAWIVSQKVYEKTKVLFKELKSMYDEQKNKQITEVKEEKQESELIKEEEFVHVSEPIQTVATTDKPKSDELSTPKEEMMPTIQEMDATPIGSTLDTKEASKSLLTNVPFLGWFFKSKQSDSVEDIQSSDIHNAKLDVNAIIVDETSGQSKQEQTESKPDLKVAEDHGQSNPEDKDMYSTRS